MKFVLLLSRMTPILLIISLIACSGGSGGGNNGNDTVIDNDRNNAPINSNWDTLVWDEGEWQ